MAFNGSQKTTKNSLFEAQVNWKLISCFPHYELHLNYQFLCTKTTNNYLDEDLITPGQTLSDGKGVDGCKIDIEVAKSKLRGTCDASEGEKQHQWQVPAI